VPKEDWGYFVRLSLEKDAMKTDNEQVEKNVDEG
jgi:hypothetical protein